MPGDNVDPVKDAQRKQMMKYAGIALAGLILGVLLVIAMRRWEGCKPMLDCSGSPAAQLAAAAAAAQASAAQAAAAQAAVAGAAQAPVA